jgi:hypothetical protein
MGQCTVCGAQDEPDRARRSNCGRGDMETRTDIDDSAGWDEAIY